jgi:inorganic pyrophosphatase
MPDFNQVLTPGDYKNGTINVVIEIPEGSRLKVEWDREHAAFKLDRIEPSIFAKPCNYGFIPQKFEDDGEVDDKIVCMPLDNRDEGDWLTSLDGHDALVRKLEHHFTHYKDLKKPGSTKVLGWGDVEEAKEIITKSIERYNSK